MLLCLFWLEGQILLFSCKYYLNISKKKSFFVSHPFWLVAPFAALSSPRFHLCCSIILSAKHVSLCVMLLSLCRKLGDLPPPVDGNSWQRYWIATAFFVFLSCLIQFFFLLRLMACANCLHIFEMCIRFGWIQLKKGMVWCSSADERCKPG